jgi:hypothetical protein
LTSELTLDDGWLKDLLEVAKLDMVSALAKLAASPLSAGEKQGVSMALKGIATFEDSSDSGKPRPSTEQLARIQDGVLLDPIDSAYIRTWLLYVRNLGVVKDEGSVQGEDHEPQKEEGPHPLGVQLSLSAYGFADQGPGNEDAEKVEDD